MKTRVWIEGSIIVALSCLCLIEARRLIVFQDPAVLYDPLGPGWYIFAVALCTLLSGIAYIFANARKPQESTTDEKVDTPINYRLWGTIAASLFYAGLIYVFGYYVSTVIFFLLEFRILGIKSWITNISSSIAISTALWLIFINYSDITFPPGVLY